MEEVITYSGVNLIFIIMSKPINRRKFLTNTSLSAAGIILGTNLAGCTSHNEPAISSYDIMKDVMKYRKIDAHCHPEDDLGKQIGDCRQAGNRKMQISKPVTNFSGNDPEGPEQVRKNNDIVINAVKKYPDRFIGFFTLNPLYQERIDGGDKTMC